MSGTLSVYPFQFPARSAGSPCFQFSRVQRGITVMSRLASLSGGINSGLLTKDAA
jgi:hypothetical protein